MLPAQRNQQIVQHQEELEQHLRFILMGTRFDNQYDLEHFLSRFLIIRIPTNHYQIMYDAAQCRNNSEYEREDAKRRVKIVLADMLANHFGEYELVCFVDLSKMEAQAIHLNLQWGMWMKLIPKRVDYNKQNYVQEELNKGIVDKPGIDGKPFKLLINDKWK